MKILVVTPYPPARDGIAAYAAQTVRSLRREGHDVEVLSPGPSAAHFHLDLSGPRGGLALAKRIRQGRYDRVIVQFHPDFFYPVPNTARDRLRVTVGLLAAFRLAGRVEVIVHEIDYRFGRPTTPDGAAARLLWRSVDSVGVHTEGERTHFARAFGVPMSKIVLISHGADFTKHTQHSRASARDSLSVPAGEFMFLSIGFVQEHKGFDRAVTAFAGLGARGSRLDIVGSVRVDDAHQLAYGNSLDVLAAATDGVHRHTGYVSDELFDRWIVAADALVLPYRSIWSSGVLERAALYDTPVIATAVGGLPEQAIAPGPGVPATGRRDVRLVEDDAELRQVMWERAGARGGSPPAGAAWPADGVDLRSRIQREVARRAVGSRGTRVAAAAAAGPGDSADAGGAGDPAEVARAADISRSSAPIRRVGTLHLPPATSNRSSAALVKRLVRRLTAWQAEPVVGAVNSLRAATVEAIETMASLPAPGAATGGAGPSGPVPARHRLGDLDYPPLPCESGGVEPHAGAGVATPDR